ncbi:Crp/Fnr family transcriptional regulator [Ideonella sp. BN130291]|uniref:Crp/Fnr family transcriptional regulator n=1 Tax=Ideonella sp. BN130291 TaxID=3112940 RepID=UPI002E26AE0D|nr:Crp/Fnr family transcriptional regulator [Ideonella sp. BN130291]
MSPKTPPPPSLLPALRSNAWFGACPAAFQQALLERACLWQLQPGEALFERGEEAEGLCCVVSGALHAGAVHADGTRTLLAHLEPYQWFGEVSMLDDLPRTHDAVADSAASVLVVPRASLMHWLAEHPADWQHLARLACAKLRLVFTVLEDIQRLPLEQRLAKRLWLTAHGYDSDAPQAPPRRQIRVPQEQLALMLGVSRQSVNKALRQLEVQGLLGLRYGSIELLDLPALQRLFAA